MEGALASFFSAQTLIFSIVIYFIVQVIRTIAEFIAFKFFARFFSEERNDKIYDFWRELVLPKLPIFVGGLVAAFAISYPFPAAFSGFYGRVFFGLVAGGASGSVYRFFRYFIKRTLPQDMREKFDRTKKS